MKTNKSWTNNISIECIISSLNLTIIFPPFFVIVDERCILSLSGKTVWRCDRFLELLQSPEIMMTKKESFPFSTSKDYVNLAGWEISVTSTIDSNATPDEVIKGWRMLNNDIGTDTIDRLFPPFFILTVADVNGRSTKDIRVFEPRVIELLRLSYWYLRISKNDKTNTFAHKVSEIKGKLAKKALSNIEDYKTSTEKPNFVTDSNEFDKEIRSSLSLVNQGKPLDAGFETYMKQMRKSLWSVISELQLSGICQKNSLVVSFDKSRNGADYDIIVNGIPCQVKNITTEDDNARELFKMIDERVAEYEKGKKIEQDEVEKSIRDEIEYRKKSINKAIEQGVRIVFINGTHSYPGFLANKYASDNNLTIPFATIIQKSIHQLNEDDKSNQLGSTIKEIYVIFGAGAIDIEYRYSAYGFSILYDTNTKILNFDESKKI